MNPLDIAPWKDRLRQMQHQSAEALSLAQQALAIREQVLGTLHSNATEIN